VLCASSLWLAGTAGAETIVSLGDSFSSGEAAGSYDADTDNKDGVKRSHKCHRSPRAWPRLLGVTREHHLACSGAKLRDLQQGQVNHAPDDTGQIQRLAALAQGTRFDRVVVTMGGNDVGFGPRVRDCYIVGSVACLNNLGDIKRDLKALQPKITEQYRAIMQAAGAPLLVAGYPNILPAANVKTVRCSGWATKRDRHRAAELVQALDTNLHAAATAAGADFVSLADVLKGHELCTKESWVQKLHAVPSRDQQQAHPLEQGQLAMAVRVRDWLKAHQGACTPTNDVAAIVDDSGSMDVNDPENIRRRALELLITKPAAQGRTFGAVEFGTDAGQLFAPAPVSSGRDVMLASLPALANDGFFDDGSTDYNDAFQASVGEQPQAGARIFLTDGEHNEGEYADGHLGGPRTFVIGLNIGPDDGSSEAAGLLGRIASDTGGTYYPLRLQPGDSPATQVGRLQPVLNEIDTRIGCSPVEAESTIMMSAPRKAGPQVQSLFDRQAAMEVVVSWGTATADVDLAAAVVRNRAGRVVADLKGRKRGRGKKRAKRGRAKLLVSTVEGATFDTITIKRPRKGRTLALRLVAPVLPAPTEVTVQFRPVSAGPTSGGTAPVVTPPIPVPSPTPTATPIPIATSTPQPPPPPPRRVITVDNRVTNGMGMREDSSPARLTTQPWVRCTSRGCNINGTERGSGGAYDAAVCQTTGERTTNGNDGSAADDANPELFSSTRYYGVRLGNGTFGYVSEVWIRAGDRGGLGLPGC
jgi:hypothetical protein